MRFPIIEFEKTKNANPYWSSLICFCSVVENRNLDEITIRKYFSKLVEKEDYQGSSKKELLEFILSLCRSKKRPCYSP